ncbi:bifunctional protein FolC [Psychromonas marina]|uniref:Dihydrofolate synthase/folylpolyglutamate synthase n=1 Tax=Psychromonas marina TaxID=88364 RepID=A0ABQ6E297_9GAMM|nr:bifunctional tetrahydrofolate synthase/dihydrofolate synthase [Psychromonas marina]GLS91491.1 bifunctional protein FolC [Psychromonas marina]
MKMNKRSLNEWLSYLEKLHPTEIELGLTRIGKVANDLNVIHFDAKVITVAGTNGKGTTCAFLEEILIQAGYKVGVYSSPHIQRYTERLRINKQEMPEQFHCQAFEKIESLRGDTSLSYFEYVTLGCLDILKAEKCDFILLEVGLGGRLDATNVVESDVSVVTTIGIDHIDWLGDDREKIGFEKAGVFRASKPVICGELDAPQSLQQHAENINADIRYAGKDFQATIGANSWSWSGHKNIDNLPLTLMPLQNASTALAVIEALELELPVTLLTNAIGHAQLAGRLQKVSSETQVDTYLDVAHNPQSAEYLATQLQHLRKPGGKVFAIVGMLEDKDLTGTFAVINSAIDYYHLIPLECYRGASQQTLLKHYQASNDLPAKVDCFETIADAYNRVLSKANNDDIIIVFGSFYTVSAFLTFSQG